MQETDWQNIKQTWLSMGANRDLRALQRHIEHKYRVKMPLSELRIEGNKRNWTAEAIEFDSKLNRKIDALTIDSLSKELAAERVNGYRTLRKQVAEFSDLMTLMLPKVRRHIESKAVISIDDVRKYMETLLKVRQFMDNQEVPISMGDDDALGAIDYSNPAELGRALIAASNIREINLEDLEGMKEPTHGKA